MIVSHPGRWFIATPTKTGTHTLEAIATRPVNADVLEVAGASRSDNRRRMHRMAPDPAWDGYHGHLLVRNPWSRWVSVYEYLRAPKFYAQWGAKEVQGKTWGGTKDPAVAATLGDPLDFPGFLRWLLVQRARHYTPAARSRRGSLALTSAYRSPWVWLDSQVASYSFLTANCNGHGQPGLLHLEHLATELRDLIGDVAGQLDLHVDRLNKTTEPLHPHWTDYWQTPTTRSLATRLHIDREADALGYPEEPV